MNNLILALAFAVLSCSSATPSDSLEGIVRENPKVSKPHFQRMSRWFLVADDGNWDIYTEGKDQEIAQYANKRVRIAGEKREAEIEGQHHREIVPSKITVVDP
jgi:hypothetical protein